MLDDKAVELVSKKVAKMTGDVRVAFDLMKSCFNKLHYRTKCAQQDEIVAPKLSVDLVIQVF